jgi:ABC-type multidrug transport system ATPase subunit
MAAQSAISAIGLGYRYKQAVLTDFNLELEPGTILALVGQNGAGKSTALSVLAGERKPDSGQVRVFGKDPFKREGRGFSFLLKEWPVAVPYLSPIEALTFHASIYRKKHTRDELDQILNRVGLSGLGKGRVKTFSKGMLRRLELACVLAADPAIWLLDEPQTGLDPAGVALLHDLMREARLRGRSVVLCTHVMSDLELLADQVLALVSGRTNFAGNIQDLRAACNSQSFTVEGLAPLGSEDLRALPGTVRGPFLNAEELPALLFGKNVEAP